MKMHQKTHSTKNYPFYRSIAKYSIMNAPAVDLQKITETLRDGGIHHFGWTKLSRPLSMDLYVDWIRQGHHLDMNYLAEHLTKKEFPQKFSQARSAIVMSIPYSPHPWSIEEESKQPRHNSVALYAQGKDYHTQIPHALSAVLDRLRVDFPEHRFEIFTDSAPVLERDLAYRAGLGWIGKNTCLINPKKGSLFFLAEIYTTLSLENENPWSSDFCGTCNKCIQACPTEALTEDRKLLPNRCISYWTIEAKSIPPEELRPQFGSWLFGCDICQTVCPWNQKHLVRRTEESTGAKSHQLVQELRWILTSSRKTLARELHATPLARVAGWKLQRNAIIVATNRRLTELVPEIKKWEQDLKLSKLAQWALELISKP